ncbi:type VI secretion system tube protein Hcp [uncultured Shewanella sp.]|uniref:type VI secretion system tube protein Hcp n=1 Tax=uncultured Shewanella sp. TaxID=173975 RepID=UPI002622E1D8|nr:type VI secretion system tube protein Hcp [uncultured Shewanella sp.]
MALLAQVVGCKDLPAPANTSEGSGVTGKNWFPILSLGFSFARDIQMEIGKTTNTDGGMTSMSEICFTKKSDPASEILLSLLFSPGPEGYTFEFVATKASREGAGQDMSKKMTFTNCRLSSHSLEHSEGGDAVEVISVAYTKMEVKHFHETSAGKMEAGGTVGYDCNLGKVTSSAV